mgnify:CR=1 FL=1
MLKMFGDGKESIEPTTAKRKVSIKLSDVILEGVLTEEFEDDYGPILLDNEFIAIETTYNGKPYLTTIRTSWIEYITEEKV